MTIRDDRTCSLARADTRPIVHTINLALKNFGRVVYPVLAVSNTATTGPT